MFSCSAFCFCRRRTVCSTFYLSHGHRSKCWLFSWFFLLLVGWLAGCVHLNFEKRTGTGYIHSSRQHHRSTAAEMGKVAVVSNNRFVFDWYEDMDSTNVSSMHPIDIFTRTKCILNFLRWKQSATTLRPHSICGETIVLHNAHSPHCVCHEKKLLGQFGDWIDK